MPVYKNWSNSFKSEYESIHFPTSEPEIIALISRAKQTDKKIKVIGSGHSCSTIAKSESAWLVSLENYNQILEVDESTGMVTVQAGITLQTLCSTLKTHALALQNMGTIDAQSIAGAIATGTHGTGLHQPAIDQQVVAFTLITSMGEIVRASEKENKEIYEAGKVNLGALGILSTITLKCVPNFKMKVSMHSETLPIVLTHLDSYLESPYFRFWWFPHTGMAQVWKAETTDEAVTKSSKTSDWINDLLLGNYATELGLWLTSFSPKLIRNLNKLIFKSLFKSSKDFVKYAHDAFVIPIKTRQMVMEYAIPYEHTVAAIKEMEAFIVSGRHYVHAPIEVRFAPENSSWMSMAHERTTCYIGIITYHPFGKKIPFQHYFSDIHEILKKFQARPHWAKMQYYSSQEMSDLYPRWNDFIRVKNQLDASGIFENAHLRKLLS